MNQIDVDVDWGGSTVRVGTAFFTLRRSVLTTRFSYDSTWLARRDCWSVSPDLPVTDVQATTNGLPGAFADSAPDRWGRNLIQKRHRAQSRSERGAARALTDVDVLVGVSDLTRQGALRFSDPAQPDVHLQPGGEVPKLIALPTLLHAARQAIVQNPDDHDGSEAVKLLLDAGTGSLGGARPKASVLDGDRLSIAKFPHPGDEWNVMAWEATALDLAAACGIDTPPHRLVHLGEHAIVLTERFDRTGRTRVPYLSALSLLGASDGSDADYLEVAEAIAEHGGRVRRDLHQLFLRIALSLAINNVDDHLRNHGFLRHPGGWVLAPVFDINPNPNPRAPRVTSIAGATGRDDGRAALVESAAWFDLTRDAAASILETVATTTAEWRSVAARHGLSKAEMTRFADVLDS